MTLTVAEVSEPGPERFLLLASALARRSVAVALALPGDATHTDGHRVFVAPNLEDGEQRRQVILQAALLGGGSLDPGIVKTLRGRPRAARRYLALEGRRILAGLPGWLIRAGFPQDTGGPVTGSPEESLRFALARTAVTDPPDWFGELRPGRLLGAQPLPPGMPPTDDDLTLRVKATEVPDADEVNEDGSEESWILKLLENPLSGDNALARALSKILGVSRAPGQANARGGEMPAGLLRRVDTVGSHARPLPVPLHFFTEEAPGPAAGFGGALYPEWDVYRQEYRPQWCRVIEFPGGDTPNVSAAGVERDETLRRRLARLGLGRKVIRRRLDGDDLDVDALIDFVVDLHAGYSPDETIYLERRKLARDLGVLILLDASGSATETDPHGQSVHEHQRRAAATLAATLEELGDRVAVYAFRSRGRAAVQLLTLKPFATRFGAGGRARLNQLEPDGYTRMGAAIRHAGEILKADAGTPNRLLLVVSDGFPYDDGYESRYAEADTAQALHELRADRVACLCLSIGTSTPADALGRAFGSAGHAAATKLTDLSTRMDELFSAALAELAAPHPSRRRPNGVPR
jgi:Mg-chelatase subunit ChlD